MIQFFRLKYFTLVELLASMAILLILMAVLFEMFTAAQRVWSVTSRNTEIYESARIALDLIARDLQSAVASDFPGQEIPFYIKDNNSNVGTFISADAQAVSTLCEISYRENNRVLERQSIGDGSHWDFFGDIGTDWTINPDPHDFREVVRGVKHFSMKAYPALTTGTYLSLPQVVVVSIGIYDSRADDPALPLARANQLKTETMRTFTKTIFLGGRR